jgi:putative chitinase
MITFDRTIFFDAVRPNPFPDSLTQEQVDGMDSILSTWEDDPLLDDLRWLAYMLATTFHETAFRMHPITEYGSQEYLEGKDYYPYIGRGFVQLTWEDNYRRATEELGLTGTDDLVAYPDRALDLQIASDVMFQGMVLGWFTGKSLPDYFNETTDDAYNARRIINGTDCASQIAEYHEAFLQALVLAQDIEVIPPGPPVAPIPLVTVTIETDIPVDVRIVTSSNIRIVE